MTTLIAAICAGAAGWLWTSSVAGRASRRTASGSTASHEPGTHSRAEPATDPGLLIRFRWVWAALGGIGAWTFVGGVAGQVVGVLAAVGLVVMINRAEPPAARRQRERARHELPWLVELYAAALHAGAAPGHALAMACAALPGPAAAALAPVHARLELGASPARVWEDLTRHPELGRLGRTMARAQSSGAPVVPAVRQLADELAIRARLDVEERARTVGVKAALPLGLCLLPAFLLIGIVPLVVGALSAIGW